MRSTADYRGVTAHGAEGSSLVASMWRAGNPALAMHCLPHNCNLSLGIALLLAFIKTWIVHVRTMNMWFCKSVKRKLEVQKLFDTIEAEFRDLVEFFGGVLLLLTHELDDIVKSVREPFSRIFALRAHALTDRLNWN